MEKNDGKEGKQDICIATEGCSPGRATTKGGLELSEKMVTSVHDLFLRAWCKYLES